jgi:hypothetical protein
MNPLTVAGIFAVACIAGSFVGWRAARQDRIAEAMARHPAGTKIPD